MVKNEPRLSVVWILLLHVSIDNWQFQRYGTLKRARTIRFTNSRVVDILTFSNKRFIYLLILKVDWKVTWSKAYEIGYHDPTDLNMFITFFLLNNVIVFTRLLALFNKKLNVHICTRNLNLNSNRSSKVHWLMLYYKTTPHKVPPPSEHFAPCENWDKNILTM